jgi:flagellar basal-body rod modification protein FlgD
MTSVTSTTAAATATDTSSTPTINADFTMFLKLLTAQMQNQDPLDPMDTAQYTQQLVQYSQVEQSMQQTSTLKSILSSLGTQNLTQASSMIGHMVETNSSTAGLSGDTPAQWMWSAPRDVDTMTATITDSQGKTVDTRTVVGGTAAGSFSWDGNTATGKQLSDGDYTLTLAGKDSSGNDVAITSHSVGTVTDVALENGLIQVTVNGNKVASDNLVRIGT